MNARTMRRQIERKARKEVARKARQVNARIDYEPQVPATAQFRPGEDHPLQSDDLACSVTDAPAPVSEAKLNANRANAQHSTGPRTETGKAQSCMNRFRHGLTGGSFVVLEHESQEEFDLLLESLKMEHQPGTPTELLLVKKMAQSWWLSKRAQTCQDCCFDRGYVDVPQQFALYLRYQAQHERAFYKALRELNTLRTELRRDQAAAQAAERHRADQSRKQVIHELRLAAFHSKSPAASGPRASNPPAVPLREPSQTVTPLGFESQPAPETDCSPQALAA